MTMLRALDPNATFVFEPKGQDDVPAAKRLRLVCRFLTVRKHMEVSDLRVAADTAASHHEYVQLLLDALRTLVLRVENHPTGETGVDGLLDVMTARELWDWGCQIAERQALSEIDLGNSASPQPTPAALSVSSAGEANA